jgi:hypothetical protein
MFFHVAVEAQKITLIQLCLQHSPRPIKHLADIERLRRRVTMMECHGLDALVIITAGAFTAEIIDATPFSEELPVECLASYSGTSSLSTPAEVQVVTVLTAIPIFRLSRLREGTRP